MLRIILMVIAACFGVIVAKPATKEKVAIAQIEDRSFPVTAEKPIVLVVYADSDALWCERTLASIFEQDYERYRVIFIDDGGETGDIAGKFILENNQTDKVLLIRNETKLGKNASLFRALEPCLGHEIVLFLDGKDWLTSPSTLSRLNKSYQNPQVWCALGSALDYPSYESSLNEPISCYAAIFKQMGLEALFEENGFSTHPDKFVSPLMQLASGHICKIKEPLLFANRAAPALQYPILAEETIYQPIAHFPKPKSIGAIDLLIVSKSPMQLYACLESVSRYLSSVGSISVSYKAGDGSLLAAYEKVKQDFPHVLFVEGELKSSAQYSARTTDETVLKDFTDLKTCAEWLAKTGASAFYFCQGKGEMCDLGGGVFAKGDEEISEMALFAKEGNEIALFFEESKCTHLKASSEEELAKFHRGLKVDIELLYKVESEFPHLDYKVR